jgi:uncharacterized protein (TIGR02117 family)
VANHGWHTGLILPGDALRERLGPLEGGLADAPWLEVGWGDEGFYRAERITAWLAIRAMFWPTPTVLHIVAVPDDPEWYFSGSRIAEIEVSEAGFAGLAGRVADSFERSPDGRCDCLGPGIYGESRFYRARGSYWALNTCNSWTARRVRDSGFPISAFYALTAGNVMFQLERGGARFPAEEDEEAAQALE